MQYPKMLYKGNKEKYQTVIANDEDHESELVEQGWCEYGELPEYEPRSSGSVGSGAISDRTLIPVEQFDALALKAAETEEQLATSQGEFIAFQNNVGAMKARIAELQGDTTPVGSTSYSEPKVISLNDLTLAQLQEMAESKGIAFKVRDSKGTLIELLMDYQDKELANADSNRGE